MLKMSNQSKVDGRKAGAMARAKVLSVARKKEIAEKAAVARWSKPTIDNPGMPEATHRGVMSLGGVEIPCFVLDDGRRVISGRGLTTAIGMKGRGQGVQRINSLRAVKAFDVNGLSNSIASPIKFLGESPKLGEPSDGFEATVLQDICEAILSARDAGLMTTEHEMRYVKAADALVRSFARVGIIALVDEATGYQTQRPHDTLQRFLEAFMSRELAVWVKKFPDEFYENIYAIRGWEWKGMGKNRYSVVAHYTRDLIYDRMAPGLLKELESKSPTDESGQRPNKLHQWLSPDIGDPMLASQMQTVLTVQRLARSNGWSWPKFMKMVDQVSPKKGETLELPLDD